MKKNGDHICKICGREDIYPIHLQSLQGRVLWKDAGFESAPARVSAYWMRPAHRPQSAVKGQLSHNHKLVQPLLRKLFRLFFLLRFGNRDVFYNLLIRIVYCLPKRFVRKPPRGKKRTGNNNNKYRANYFPSYGVIDSRFVMFYLIFFIKHSNS